MTELHDNWVCDVYAFIIVYTNVNCMNCHNYLASFLVSAFLVQLFAAEGTAADAWREFAVSSGGEAIQVIPYPVSPKRPQATKNDVTHL